MIIKPVIDKSKILSDGKCTIRIYIYDPASRKKLSVATGLRVEPSAWNNGQVTKYNPNSGYLNSELRKMVAGYEERFLKDGASIGAIKQKKAGLAEFIAQYKKDVGKAVSKKGQPVSPHYSKSVRNSLTVIERYFEKVGGKSFEDINQAFYNGFVTWMRYDEEYGENTIGRVIKDLKKAMKVSRAAGLHLNGAYEEFTVTNIASHSIALSEEEIDQIVSADLPPHLKQEAQRFYVSYNFLLRFNDSIRVDKKDLVSKKGKWYLETTHNKTRAKVVIPLLPKTYDILKENGFNLRKTTNQESNWKIKEAARIAEITEKVTVTEVRKGKLVKKEFDKCDLITTHTARRSMATNLWNNGFDLKQIQLMGGWKTLTSLQKYLKVDEWDNAKKAAEHPFFN